MNVAEKIAVTLAAACALSACTSSNANSATGATPQPQGSVSAYDTTNAEPANCVRKSDSFGYYDAISGRTLPHIEDFAPYPLPATIVRFYIDTVAGKRVGIELPPGAKSPKGPAYRAVPLTPVIDGVLSYGKRDQATVVILPSGKLADDYEWYLKYHAGLAQTAERASDAMFAGASPSPIPQDPALEDRDRRFTADGMPAVTALTRGAGPDDRYFKDITTLSGESYNDFDPHARIFTCDYLEKRSYDLIVTLVRKRRLADPQYGELQVQLKAQRTPDDLINNAGYVAFEKDILVARGVQPQLWLPAPAKTLDDDAVRSHAQDLPFNELARVELPAPDATVQP